MAVGFYPMGVTPPPDISRAQFVLSKFPRAQKMPVSHCAVRIAWAAPQRVPSEIMNQYEILLIEDSDSDAEFAQRTLCALGITNPTRRFASGSEALAYLLQAERAPEATSTWPAVLLID